MSKKVLIIGGVAGGAGTAARLRRLDETAEIIIFERGPYISYANCGLPYHISDVIQDRDALLLQKPEVMKARFNVDVRTENEVMAIDRQNKTLTVKNLKTGEEYKEGYDTLVISTGSSPIKPPIEGIDSEGIFTLWTIPDTDKIKAYLAEKKPKDAVVIGGGFIGLEVAENLHAAGCKVTIVEMLNQVMAPIDFEMAQLLHQNLRQNGVNLVLGDGVKKFKKKDGKIEIALQSGKVISTDMAILSIGVKPNSALAKDAGLKLNEKGGIIVDKNLKTSDPDIYAVGDVIEVDEFILKGKAMIPLAGPANKQARICADNINGGNSQYNGSMGTAVAKVFDLTAATCGLNEKTLARLGKKKGEDYFTATISQKSHAGYYPGSTQLMLKLIFDQNGKIFGGQIVGQDGVDKRIDTIAATIRLGGTIYDLEELELAYAPPYSSAKDPVNMLGFTAENILKGIVSFVDYDQIDGEGKYTGPEDYTVLDVREDFERMVSFIKGSVHIPLGQLRNRISELDKSKLIIIYCAISVRAYNAARILAANGFKNVKVYPGGTALYNSVYHDKSDKQEEKGENSPNAQTVPLVFENIAATIKVDCSGLQCPGPIMKVYNTLNEMKEGEIAEVSATDLGFAKDIEAWCKRTGNTLLKSERKDKTSIVYIKKGIDSVPLKSPCQTPEGKTIIVFSGDLDRVLASFIIANGAAAMGRPVTMFFTFWGLNVLRKSNKVNVKKSFIESMFGSMMPRGTGKLKLSKMNMGGMGTAMMKKVMHDKNVNSLEELIKKAMDNGVKLVACTMSMDIMGITKEELIDGVELAGVGAYLGDAEESNVNLFI